MPDSYRLYRSKGNSMKIWLLLYCLIGAGPALGQTLQPIEPARVTLRTMTLDEAWQAAEAASPVLRSAHANLLALDAQIAEANSTLWNNPQVSGEFARRVTPQPGLSEQNTRDWALGISQAFETGGQPQYRREAAQSEKAALEAQLNELRRQLRAEVGRSFIQVLGLQQRIALEDEAVKTVLHAASAVRSRVVAGEDTRLDGNVADVEVGRARTQLAAASAQLIEARAQLASLLQMPPGELPLAQGELDRAATYSLAELLGSANLRPQFEALTQRERAARSRLSLERAAVSPDVTVGFGVAREGPGEARDRVTGVSVSVPLPIFRRNAAAIGRAAADLTQVQIDRQAAEREARASVIALWSKLDALRSRFAQIRSSIVAKLDENQRLSTRAYREGELGLLELIVVTRQVLDGRRDLLEAVTEAALTRVALEQAAGWTGTGAKP
jgi:cobalt-zinc-cadmium efflux system outer membrane protein